MFLTEDPIRDGINWYAYVNNRPLTHVDPTGLDSVSAEWNITTGVFSLTYFPTAKDAGASRPETHTFNLANRVVNEKSNPARAQPDAQTTPADGGQSEYYYPRNFPLGKHAMSESRTPTDPRSGPVFIPTDAVRTVPVYGPVTEGSIAPAGDAEATGKQRDTAYGFHMAWNTDRPSSWGCGVTWGDNAERDILELARLVDSAINSGGTAYVEVTE